MKKIKILIVDDHFLISKGLGLYFNQIPDFEVIGYANSGQQAIELTKTLSPDVITMDVNLSGMTGMEATQQIVREFKEVKILAVSMHRESSYVRKMIQFGAMGYVSKDSPAQELVDAIYQVNEGKQYLSEAVKSCLCQQLITNTEYGHAFNSLSARELQVLNLVKEGYSSREISAMLYLSPRTVEAHRANILKKLKTNNTAHLVNCLNKI